MNVLSYFLYLLLFLSCISIFLLQKKSAKERQKINKLTERVQEALDDNYQKEAAVQFAATLSQATLTTRLQQSRIQLQSGDHGSPPEKYKFLVNMAAQGIPAEEIAAILGISNAEASQLVHLHGLSSCRS